MSGRIWPMYLIAAIAFLALAAAGSAADYSDADCTDCHTDTGGMPTEVDSDDLAGSTHADLDCVDCHVSIDRLPHITPLPRAECELCHDDVAETYRQHGRAKVGESVFVPTCVDCHGSHAIRTIDDPDSRVHPANLPMTCGYCHEDQDLIEQLNIKFKHPIELYKEGIHGKATAGGKDTAATCNDCHSTGGTAHRILPPGDHESTINFFNIPKTCGRCHGTIEREFWEGIHGQLVERGEVDAPTCTHCHGEHGILATEDPRSPVNPARVAEATCSPCHESAALNEKYDLPSGRLQSFVDSYHGLKSRAGDRTVANCASCHEAHMILPADDPRSSVAATNLPHTCGECHPGISPEVAQTQIHATATGHRAGWPHIVQIIYIWLIVMVIGSMVVHWLIDLVRQFQNVLCEPQVRRMSADAVVQHTVLMISFTLLVVTGYSLRFYDAWWSRWLFGWDGGAGVRGAVHRGSGVVMLLGSLWHLVYLVTPPGRKFLRDIAPTFEDARQFVQMMRFNLGWTGEHPHFKRFSYVEKAEYWALVWGTVVMGITGLSLWFENNFVHIFPKGLLDVFLVIHYYEAWLAFLAIVVWHMYAVIFNPQVYPGNPSWLTGKMPRRMFEAEHPAAKPESD